MRLLEPDYEYKDVTYIDERIFSGKELLIFDIDNTLVFSETTDIREDIIKWFNKINKKYKCVCFSNSHTIRKRKYLIQNQLGCEFFMSHYKKPSKTLFKEIIQLYNVKPEKIVVIGDFRFTDILFAKRNGATAILVRPIGSDKSKILKIMRKIENLIIKILKKL